MTGDRQKARLRFSLRTVFLLTALLALWLGWQAAIVRERKAVIALTKQDGGLIFAAGYSEWSRGIKVPLVRRLMGDRGVETIMISPASAPSHEARARRAFPHAHVEVEQQWVIDLWRGN